MWGKLSYISVVEALNQRFSSKLSSLRRLCGPPYPMVVLRYPPSFEVAVTLSLLEHRCRIETQILYRLHSASFYQMVVL